MENNQTPPSASTPTTGAPFSADAPPIPAPAHVEEPDVWGVRPSNAPSAGPSAFGPMSYHGDTPKDSGFPGHDDRGPRGSGNRGSATLDQGFDTLRRSPLHRDSDRGILGGVCAGIAASTGMSVVAVRAAAVLLALFFGTGIGIYLIAWAALPDQRGATHAERAMRGGRPRSLVVLALAGIALLSAVSWIFDTAVLPLLIGLAVVAYVVTQKKGHSSSHSHG